MSLPKRSPNRTAKPDDSDRPSHWSVDDSTASIPAGRIAGTRVGISYGVFFAAAAVFGAVSVLAGRPGNSDLVAASITGVAVWFSGLIVQAAVSIGFCAFAGLRLRSLVLGIIGVELPVHRWHPQRTALLVVIVLQVLAAMGFVLWLVGASHPESSFDGAGESGGWVSWMALGFSRADDAWKASGALIWFQMLCQLIPMPRTLGRIGLLSMVGTLNQSIQIEPKLVVMRKLIRVLAFLLFVAALAMATGSPGGRLPMWSVVALVGAFLWGSSGGKDLTAWLDSFAVSTLSREESETCATLLDEVRRRITDRKNERRLRDAHQREVGEAMDVARLDDILDRLHRDGFDSLSDDEQQVLRRVSQTLRDRPKFDESS
ncbi:hypothetical protein [Crateriforma conspicua]|uniref:hypothetical protein n=1 Tax=Crateriforma conspicua TaxID=2527996 RepID=UPI00118AE487|nr:hypothetical protein [Crateriforma conspicua]QDV63646.1 hypothetical protein Mal65_27920 [Crateriforma conspicua]